jgi:hypothetical protein
MKISGPQKATLDLLANMDRPDMGEAVLALELCVSVSAPPRVTTAIEDYIDASMIAGTKAKESKAAAEAASEAWKLVKSEASRDEDIVDLANEARA